MEGVVLLHPKRLVGVNSKWYLHQKNNIILALWTKLN